MKRNIYRAHCRQIVLLVAGYVFARKARVQWPGCLMKLKLKAVWYAVPFVRRERNMGRARTHLSTPVPGKYDKRLVCVVRILVGLRRS